MLQAGTISLLGLGLNHVTALREADASPEQPPSAGRAKSVIFVFLSGGLTQHDSFDPKPEAPVGIRGLFSPIATRSPGVQICEHLPLLAARSQKWSVIRSLTTPYNKHSQGHTSILTGRTPMPVGYDPSKPQSSDWPSIASVVGVALPQRNNNLPPAIVLPERLIHNTGQVLPGQFGGQMESRRDPWFVEASPYNPKSYGALSGLRVSFCPWTRSQGICTIRVHCGRRPSRRSGRWCFGRRWGLPREVTATSGESRSDDLPFARHLGHRRVERRIGSPASHLFR